MAVGITMMAASVLCACFIINNSDTQFMTYMCIAVCLMVFIGGVAVIFRSFRNKQDDKPK